MPTIRLTQLAVDKIVSPKAGRLEYFDAILPGFGLRVSNTGARSWILLFRVDGKLRRLTIGTAAEVPRVEDARLQARTALEAAATGNDPARQKVSDNETSRRRREDTVSAVVERHVARYCKPRNRSWRDTEQILVNHVVSRWGDRHIGSIARRDVRELLDDLAARGFGAGANRVLAATRKLFAWAMEQGIIDASPCVALQAPAVESERDRVLRDDELIVVWRAAEAMGGVAGAFVRMLALTGQRRDEVASIRRHDVDFDKGLWTLPREATKGDRSHEVPLAPLAGEILRSLPDPGEWFFTTTGDRPISGYSKIKARLDRLAPIEGWRFHDLRRTAGTGMARRGIAVSTISRVLNHKEGGVTKIYNRYSYLDEKRHALDTWATHVSGLLTSSAGNIVTLRQTA
jgi:integrase